MNAGAHTFPVIPTQVLGTPETYTRLKLEQALQAARMAVGEIERALAKSDAGILAHVHVHCDNIEWPARRALDFAREAAVAALSVEQDEAMRMAMGLPRVTEPVADVSDAERWPEIAAAVDHARKMREERP